MADKQKYLDYDGLGKYNEKIAPIDSPEFTGAISMGRKEGSTVGANSTAIGTDVVASEKDAVAMGTSTTAYGKSSHAEGWSDNSAIDICGDISGLTTDQIIEKWSTYDADNDKYPNSFSLAYGEESHVEGGNCLALDYDCHAEGWKTIASGGISHAEGSNTTASGEASHAEGSNTTSSGDCSHAEGSRTTASGKYSHAEGFYTTSSGKYSHAEGFYTTSSGNSCHAEGYMTTASVRSSHAEGWSTNKATDICGDISTLTVDEIIEKWNTSKFLLAYSYNCHAEGNDCLTLESCAHSEGSNTIAKGFLSHSEGNNTIALANQHAQGHYNNTATATANNSSGTSDGTAFVIGNGTSDAPSNAFRVTGEGNVYGAGNYNSSGADYAEYFEWYDGNTKEEDLVGYFVTVKGDKLVIANEGDYILGIITGNPSVIGNSDECWTKRFVRDDFGRYITEEIEYEIDVFVEAEEANDEDNEVSTVNENSVSDENSIEKAKNENGDKIKVKKEKRKGIMWKQNPNYDETQTYIPRSKRAEWDAVGMVGVLSVYDDGTCKVNGYCKCANGGIATSATVDEFTFLTPIYRVISRVSANVVKVVMR